MLLMATLKTESTLTTPHLMVLPLINIINIKMTVRLMGTLQSKPSADKYVCFHINVFFAFALSGLSSYQGWGLQSKREK